MIFLVDVVCTCERSVLFLCIVENTPDANGLVLGARENFVMGEEDRVDPVGVTPEGPESSTCIGRQDFYRAIIRPRGEEALLSSKRGRTP